MTELMAYVNDYGIVVLMLAMIVCTLCLRRPQTHSTRVVTVPISRHTGDRDIANDVTPYVDDVKDDSPPPYSQISV